MNTNILKLILWQGFEKPKNLIEIILSIFSWILSLIIIFVFFVILRDININILLKILIFTYISINALLIGCYFDGRSYIDSNSIILKIIYGSGVILIILTNIWVIIYFLKKMKYKK